MPASRRILPPEPRQRSSHSSHTPADQARSAAWDDCRRSGYLTEFLENALHDAAFVTYDPNSSTATLQPDERDLTYSKYRPDLAALGAKDGFMLSGLAIDNNDPLSRRDQGLEILDVTPQLTAEKITSQTQGSRQMDQVRITNTSSTLVDTHLLVIVRGLSNQARLGNSSGITQSGDRYIRVFLRDGVVRPGQSLLQTLTFIRRNGNNDAPVSYALDFLSGRGKP